MIRGRIKQSQFHIPLSVSIKSTRVYLQKNIKKKFADYHINPFRTPFPRVLAILGMGTLLFKWYSEILLGIANPEDLIYEDFAVSGN